MDTLTQAHDITAFHEHAEFTGVMADERAKWLDMRHTMITASDMAAIMGEDPHRDAWDVYVDKVTPRDAADEALELDDPRFWGTVLEQPIARAVCAHYGWEYHEGGALLRSRKHPIIGCTLDGEVKRDASEGWIIWEGKTSRVTREWNENEQDLPTHVLIQNQTQMLVTQPPRCLTFALLVGSRPCQVIVEPSPEYHAVLVEQAEWMLDLVRRGEPPTPTHLSKRAIQRLYPEPDGSTVALPMDAVEWTREVIEIDRKLKDLERRKETLRNMLRASIGEALYGELPASVEGKEFWKNGLIAGGLVERAEYYRQPYRQLRAVKSNTPKATSGQTRRRRARR